MNVEAWSHSPVGLGGNYEVEFHTSHRNFVLNKAKKNERIQLKTRSKVYFFAGPQKDANLQT